MAASNVRHLISAAVALAAAKRRTTSVGVCWTRNEVPPVSYTHLTLPTKA